MRRGHKMAPHVTPELIHGQFIGNRASLAWSKSFAIESPAIAQLAAIVVAGAP